MQNRNTDATTLKDTAVSNFQKVADMSVDFYRNLFDILLQNNTGFSETLTQVSRNTLRPLQSMFNSGDCCPPKQECPPHCIAAIERHAMSGETILVPFLIKNSCSSPRSYKVGVRELMDQDQKNPPRQPQLNKNVVTLPPYGTERVLLKLDLSDFPNGTFTTEIVLREKEFNQNICFTLIVGDHPAVIAEPGDEKRFKLRWQSWKSHYYCEPQKR